MIKLPDNSFTQDEDKLLHIIYHEYLAQKSITPLNTYQSKIFQVNSLFPDEQKNPIMSTLVKLSIKRIIRLFSDKRFMLNEKAIPYIEKRLNKNSMI